MLTHVLVTAFIGLPLPMQAVPTTVPQQPTVQPAPQPAVPQPAVPVAPPVQPQPLPPQPLPPQPVQPLPAQPPPTGWGQPHYPQPSYPYPPGPTPPAATAPAAVGQKPETGALPSGGQGEDVGLFARLNLGLGPPGLSGNTSLLRTEGYGGIKLWTTLDAAYMFHRHVGAGVWFGLNRRASAPEIGPSLNEVSYFVAAQAPIMIVGSRAFALHVTPRIGYAAGKVELDTAAESDFQHSVIWGGAIDAISFKYHVTGGIALMRAETGPPGEAGRDHDYGGFYVTLGATIDG